MIASIAAIRSAGTPVSPPPASADRPAAFADVLRDATATRSTAADPEAAALSRLTTALTDFKKEAAMTPVQRIRRDLMQKMKLTDQDLAAMTPERRKATEATIDAEIARRLHLEEGTREQPDGAANLII